MSIHFDPSRIVLARESRGLTQAKLAELLGVTAQQLSQWEKGEIRPSTENAAKIMNALEAPSSFFFVRSGAFGATKCEPCQQKVESGEM